MIYSVLPLAAPTRSPLPSPHPLLLSLLSLSLSLSPPETNVLEKLGPILHRLTSGGSVSPSLDTVEGVATAIPMSWLERGGMCHGGGFFYSQLNPDVNHAVAGFPDDGSADGFLRFAGPEDGGVGWLLNGAKAAELSAHERMPSLVAPPIKSSDWLSSSCSSRPAVPGGCWSTESLPETTSMSLPADVPMAGRAASLGTAIAYSGASFAGNSPTSSFATAEKATSSGKCEGTTSEREARVMRYREKRKRRRFEKQIRYASRKAYADTRPRIRGRFAKTPEEKQPPSPAPLNVSAQNGMGWFRS